MNVTTSKTMSATHSQLSYHYYVGPIQFNVNWKCKLKPSHVESPYLKYYSDKKTKPLYFATIDILDTVDSLRTAPQNCSELKENWRVWKEDQTWIMQVWSGETKKYCLEAVLSEDFSSATVCCLNTQPERKFLPFLIATLTRWMTVHIAAEHHGFLLHSMAVQKKSDGSVFVGTGPSGAGKTTLSSFFVDEPDYEILTDETSLVMQSQDSNNFYVYGTPWPGMLDRATNQGGKIVAMLYLDKTLEHSLTELSSHQVAIRFFQEIFLPPWNIEVTDKVIQAASEFIARVPQKALGFKKEKTVVDFIRRTL